MGNSITDKISLILSKEKKTRKIVSEDWIQNMFEQMCKLKGKYEGQ